MNIRSRIRRSVTLIGNVYVRPIVTGRYLGRVPQFGGALTIFLLVQMALAAWLVSRDALLRISPAGFLLPFTIPIRTVITMTLGAIFLRLCVRLAGPRISWRISASIVVYAGLVFLLGDLVKVVLRTAWTPMMASDPPSLASVFSVGGLGGKWLREAHVVAAVFIAMMALMVNGATRIRPAASCAIASAVWMLMTAFRISFLQVFLSLVR